MAEHPLEEHAALRRVTARANDDPDVLAVIVYGSTARQDAGPGSDIDVCLVLRPDAAVHPSEKRLEYLAHFDLDVQVLSSSPPPA